MVPVGDWTSISAIFMSTLSQTRCWSFTSRASDRISAGGRLCIPTVKNGWLPDQRPFSTQKTDRSILPLCGGIVTSMAIIRSWLPASTISPPRINTVSVETFSAKSVFTTGTSKRSPSVSSAVPGDSATCSEITILFSRIASLNVM